MMFENCCKNLYLSEQNFEAIEQTIFKKNSEPNFEKFNFKHFFK